MKKKVRKKNTNEKKKKKFFLHKEWVTKGKNDMGIEIDQIDWYIKK